MKLSPIFPPHIKPVRIGRYRTASAKNYPCYYMAIWDAKRWWWVDGDPCIVQDRYWQGLAEEPK